MPKEPVARHHYDRGRRLSVDVAGHRINAATGAVVIMMVKQPLVMNDGRLPARTAIMFQIFINVYTHIVAIERGETYTTFTLVDGLPEY